MNETLLRLTAAGWGVSVFFRPPYDPDNALWRAHAHALGETRLRSYWENADTPTQALERLVAVLDKAPPPDPDRLRVVAQARLIEVS